MGAEKVYGVCKGGDMIKWLVIFWIIVSLFFASVGYLIFDGFVSRPTAFKAKTAEVIHDCCCR